MTSAYAALLTPTLRADVVYSWDELGAVFGFSPRYLSAAGGMPVSAATNSVFLTTFPNGGKSFDYKDHWDGPDLISQKQ